MASPEGVDVELGQGTGLRAGRGIALQWDDPGRNFDGDLRNHYGEKGPTTCVPGQIADVMFACPQTTSAITDHA